MENPLKKKLPTKYVGDEKPYTARDYYGFLNVPRNGKNYPLSIFSRMNLRIY